MENEEILATPTLNYDRVLPESRHRTRAWWMLLSLGLGFWLLALYMPLELANKDSVLRWTVQRDSWDGATGIYLILSLVEEIVMATLGGIYIITSFMVRTGSRRAADIAQMTAIGSTSVLPLLILFSFICGFVESTWNIWMPSGWFTGGMLNFHFVLCAVAYPLTFIANIVSLKTLTKAIQATEKMN